jgi:amino acid transporter
MNPNNGLERRIGLWGFVSNIINIIIGAGIFILPAIVAENAGNLSALAYIISGLLMILIMLCFADIGSKITVTGGAYVYIERTFGKYAGFLTTNLFVFGAGLTANAAVANGLADTLSYLLPEFKNKVIRSGFFILMFGSLALVNVRGIKQGMWLVNFNTITKLVPLLFIVLFGWFYLNSSEGQTTVNPDVNDIGQMALILIFAFAGAETALNVSGEIKNPRKNIPRGIFLGMAIVLVLFILIQIVVQGILGQDIVFFKEAPLAEAASRMIGPAGATLVVLGAVFAMFGNLSGLILNMPRLIFAAAKDRVILPASLARLHPTFHTPFVSVILYATLGCLFAVLGEFRQLAILSSTSFLLIYLGVVLATIRIRLKGIREADSYTIPGGLTIPVLAVLSIVWFLSNLSWQEMSGMAIFLAVLSLLFLAVRGLNRTEKKS